MPPVQKGCDCVRPRAEAQVALCILSPNFCTPTQSWTQSLKENQNLPVRFSHVKCNCPALPEFGVIFQICTYLSAYSHYKPFTFRSDESARYNTHHNPVMYGLNRTVGTKSVSFSRSFPTVNLSKHELDFPMVKLQTEICFFTLLFFCSFKVHLDFII